MLEGALEACGYFIFNTTTAFHQHEPLTLTSPTEQSSVTSSQYLALVKSLNAMAFLKSARRVGAGGKFELHFLRSHSNPPW